MSPRLIILCSLIGLVVSQCPPGNCPPPVDPPSCGEPDCSIATNRYHANALFPHPDPNFYWQCAPTAVGVFTALARPCACGTVFNVNENPRRCTFWFDRSWTVAPSCNWQNPPELKPCAPWCPDCNGPTPTPPTTVTVTTATPGTTTTDEEPPPGGELTTTTEPETTTNACGCPPSCPPCIWWPCIQCIPCWCQQQRQPSQRFELGF